MTDDEKFLFDLNGYLVIENVLTEDEVTLANKAIDQHSDLIKNRDPGLSNGAEALIGKIGRGELHESPLSFERPWCEPFRRMLTHPKVTDIFNEILGPGWRLDHGPGLIQMVKGTEGHRLHGGMTFDPSQYHHFVHDRMLCGLCVASWQLKEVRPGDGGFACIPGSHKSNFVNDLPTDVRRHERSAHYVRQVEAQAGDVIIFTEALMHGTLAWNATTERRSLLYKYSPGHSSWSRHYYDMDDYQDLTEQQQRFLMPPFIGEREDTVQEKS